MLDRLPPRHAALGTRHTSRPCATSTSAPSSSWDPRSRFPPPPAASRIDPSLRDKWGLPVLRFEGNVHPHTFEIGEVQAKRAEAWLKEAGAIQTLSHGVASRNASAPVSTRPAPAAWATIRTVRSSIAYCQIHDVDNVFVIDGSVHVTNGGFNPALTIMAVAYYASDCAGAQLERHGSSGHDDAFSNSSAVARRALGTRWAWLAAMARRITTPPQAAACAELPRDGRYTSMRSTASAHRNATCHGLPRSQPRHQAAPCPRSPHAATLPEAIRLRDIDVRADDRELPAMPPARIRKLACGTAQRHVQRHLHQCRAQHRSAA